MHEYSIVVYIVDKVEKIAKEQKLTHIKSITMELGEVSSVLSDYLLDCWNYIHKKSELLKETELIIEMKPAVTICDDCKQTYSTVQYGKKCPYCGSVYTELLTGNQFTLKELEAY